MERVDLLARVGDERDVHRPARRRLAVRDDEVRELRAVLALPDRRNPERLEGGLVERDTRGASRTRMWTWSMTTRVQSQSLMP